VSVVGERAEGRLVGGKTWSVFVSVEMSLRSDVAECGVHKIWGLFCAAIISSIKY